MNHATAHLHSLSQHTCVHAGFLKGSDTTGGDSQVNGTSGRNSLFPHIRASFKEIYLEATAGKEYSQERPDQTAPHKCHFRLMTARRITGSTSILRHLFSLRGKTPDYFCKSEHIFETTIERRRCGSDYIGLAEITDDAFIFEFIKDAFAALEAQAQL